ncbi:MAG: hypothetical protein CVU54_04130 [Deltaproteobacteria bacterium HGW-Deltaproteobacteria-12]|nr:MAG: hypothetical protein CVU54_04130 [Deltaproteobacteria bacterium HGW-Deltaproteobacteria-12]
MKQFSFGKIIIILIVTLHVACARQAIIFSDSSAEKTLLTISSSLPETYIMTASAQIDLVVPEGHYPARAVVILKKPSYLRLELLPPIGTPEFFLTANPNEMKILLPGKNEFYSGKPTGHNLSRFLPWQFDVEDILAVLAGAYPPLTGNVNYSRHPEGENVRIEMKAQSRIEQTVWLGPHGRLIRLVRRDEYGRELYSAEFADYDEASPIAGKITLRMSDGGNSITVKYSGLQIEKAKDLSIFDLPVPAGFKTIILD